MNKLGQFPVSRSGLYVYGLFRALSGRTQPPMQQMKGYGSNQTKLRGVVALPAAEPVTLRVLHIREHACEQKVRQKSKPLTRL